MRANKHCPSPEIEAEWEARKSAFYEQWRAEKLTAAAEYVRAAVSAQDACARVVRVREKFGKRFAVDLEKLLMGQD